MAITLHKLLWGVGKAKCIDDWVIRACEIPAVGLPARVATALFVAARKEQLPIGWSPNDGPLVWQIGNRKKVLSAGRQLQLGYSHFSKLKQGRKRPRVTKSLDWEVPPHPAYYLPFVEGTSVHAESYALYCDVLLFLTALDGGERILDSLSRSGLAGVPFEDRWAWRARIHLQDKMWRALDRIVQWTNTPLQKVSWSPPSRLSQASWRRFGLADFDAERIDLLLEEGKYLELVRSTSAFEASPSLPEALKLSESGLSEDLTMRIAQLSKWYSRVPQRFPRVAVAEADRLMQQVAASFAGRASDNQPNLLLLPEVSIPQNEVRTLRQLVAKTGIAALYGLFWRELPAAYPGETGVAKWVVNEAELVMPLGHDTAGPPTVRWFRIRKPVPAHIEEGLAKSLTKRSGVKHRLLRGRRWYRFLHRQWGDFSIAICADLIDAEPWRTFRGEMLHLFTVAFNKDVELYDALTWVRAYESYVNVLAVNHGGYGGSFVWTPKGSHSRELARLRGSDLFLLVDVDLPVKSLLDAQTRGVKRAVASAENTWNNKKLKRQPFKSPPPGFRRKQIVGK